MLRHEQFGQSSERGALLDQLELQLADLEENAAHAETAAQLAAAETITVPAFERRKPARRRFRRICRASASSIRRLRPAMLRRQPLAQDGEDMTETLELIPRQWKVIQHVREKFSCRACEAITQAAGALASDQRARARSLELLAHVLFAKYGLHLPLNRQSDVYRTRRHRSRCLDAGGLGGRGGGNPDAAR